MSEALGSWKTGSGLLDDFVMTIEEAWFGTNEKFGDAVLLNVRGFAEQENEEGNLEVVDDEHTLLYSCGDGWEVAKGGREANHAAGKTTFIKNTNMGRLIDAVVGLGGDVVKEMGSRGDTFEADTWEGLVFHIERKQFSYKDRETEEVISYEVPLPVDFIGVYESEEEEKPKAKGKAKSKGRGTGSKTKAKAEPEPEEDADDEPEEKPKAKGRGRKKKVTLREAVTTFAGDYEDHADFLEEVFDPDVFDRAEELQEDEELSAEVLDEDGAVWVDSGDDEDE